MTNTQQIVNEVVDAITASGKTFQSIKREAIYQFLYKRDVPKDMWEGLYDKISESYAPKSTKSKTNATKVQQKDYYSNSHNETKKRTPRKSILGPVKKI